MYTVWVTARPPGPGLRKARSLPLLTKRTVELWQSSDYRIREIFEQADVMSEGACKQEAGGQVYYGTTSIVLPARSAGGMLPDSELQQVMRMLAVDPHARLRAVRIACREAHVRAAVKLGQLRVELNFSGSTRGLKIDIDVEGPERASQTGDSPSPRGSQYGTG